MEMGPGQPSIHFPALVDVSFPGDSLLNVHLVRWLRLVEDLNLTITTTGALRLAAFCIPHSRSLFAQRDSSSAYSSDYCNTFPSRQQLDCEPSSRPP